jgi:hypothetical protein
MSEIKEQKIETSIHPIDRLKEYSGKVHHYTNDLTTIVYNHKYQEYEFHWFVFDKCLIYEPKYDPKFSNHSETWFHDYQFGEYCASHQQVELLVPEADNLNKKSTGLAAGTKIENLIESGYCVYIMADQKDKYCNSIEHSPLIAIYSRKKYIGKDIYVFKRCSNNGNVNVEYFILTEAKQYHTIHNHDNTIIIPCK